MENKKAIKKNIKKDLERFNEMLEQYALSDNEKLNSIAEHILKSKGKQLRPQLVFLSARMNGGMNKRTFIAAVLIELLHTATLIHDDVVDEAGLRRGQKTVNNIWENKTAVLVGDYLFSRAMTIATREGEYALFDMLSPVVNEMSIGEIIQLEESRKTNYDEGIYYDIIRRKTAELISACMRCGAMTGGEDYDVTERMSKIGYYAGMAFQIKDDILDYTGNGHTGKETGNDIREHKITLPLIKALETADEETQKEITTYFDGSNDTKDNLKKVLDFVKRHNGIEIAQKKVNDYIEKAERLICEMKESDERDLLRDTIRYIAKRTK